MPPSRFDPKTALHLAQRHLLWLLLATYLAGAAWPGPGLALRQIRCGHLGATELSPPVLMLGVLLMVAGLGARPDELLRVARTPRLLIAGIVANGLYRVLFVALVAALAPLWHDLDEAQNVLVGLGLVGAMPIAGSSTAWAQNAEGNVALSLGLVWCSTLLSPLLTPLALHAAGTMTHGDYSEDLHELAAGSSSSFILVSIVVPSVLGVALQWLVGARRIAAWLPTLKLANLVNLLALTYVNAAAALPRAIREPDPDLLVLVLALTCAMCTGAFACGWLLARAVKARSAEQISLMFGLGMSNNGSGLVLAAAALADHPLVLLPLIFYNLVQQIVAGCIHRVGPRRRRVEAA